MKILNPFKLQNWEYKKFLIVILGIQLSLLGLFGLNKLGIETPILRASIGFIYISFVPGYLILRILKLNKIDSLESFLYSVGLSVFFVILIGFLMNAIFPNFGITDKPLSEIPIILFLSVSVCLLIIISYFVDLKNNTPEYFDLNNILNPQFLFLSLIPFLAIFGTYLVNTSKSNILLLILILVIAISSLRIIKYSKNIYQYSIWIFSISLLFHMCLITPYLHINDITSEYYLSKTIISNNFWDCSVSPYGIPKTYNSVLTPSIFAPLIYFISGISLIGIYKYIFAAYYSLLPLVIYIISKKISNDSKIAYASALLYISSYDFIKISLITKQSISMFFGALLIYTILKNSKNTNFKLLIFIFGIGMIVSHYGTAFILCSMLTLPAIGLILFHKKEECLTYSKMLVILFLILFGWQMFLSKSSSFSMIIGTIVSSVISLKSQFLDVNESRGLYTLTKEMPTYSAKLIKYITYMVMSFSLFGYFLNILKYLRDIKKKVATFTETFILSSAFFWYSLLVMSVIMPGLAVMDPRRLFEVSLILISSFVLYGGNKLFSLLLKNSENKNTSKVVSLFVILMLLSTKFIPEILSEELYSPAISQNRLFETGDAYAIAMFYLGITPVENVYSGSWISNTRDYNAAIYRKETVYLYPSLCLYNNISPENVRNIISVFEKNGDYFITEKTPEKSQYLQLSVSNVKYETYWGWYNKLHQLVPYKTSIGYPQYSKIYDNLGSQIYFT